jgi:LuxR family maltose regulon positive regulatory protein
VTVDERDADPHVLLRHVAAALDRVVPLDPRVLDAFDDAPDASIWTAIVPRLGAAIDGTDEPLLIVLDDVHVLRARASLEAVAALVDHLGAGSTLVLAGRSLPRLPTASLRAAGALLEIGTDDLALTPREGQLLYRRAGTELTLAEATELVRRCEGWPAALALAARGHDAPDELSGRERAIADYVRAECLAHLRPRTLAFLRRTSVLGRMCGELCDAVLEDQGSGHELEQLEHSSLLLVPLDREGLWYRQHRLVRELLRRELTNHEPSLASELHRRAAEWCEAHDDPETALEHAVSAGDLAHAARIVSRIALPAYSAGRADLVERWLARFDDPALLRRHSKVAVQGGLVHALRGRPPEAQGWLRCAEQGRARGVAVLHAALCHDEADAEAAVARLPDASPLRPYALLALGASHLRAGEPEHADAAFAAVSGANDACVVALAERSLLAAARGDHAAAEDLARAAQELIAAAQLDGYPTSALAFAASARVSLRHGRWDEARTHLAHAQQLPTPALPWLALQTKVELARTSLALRDAHAVHAHLAEIHAFLREAPDLGAIADEARSLARQADGMVSPRAGATSGLTAAELRLLPLLATHRSFREIGERLHVSRNTVKTQAISVYRKLGVSSRTEAVDRAAQLGLVGDEAG